MQKPIERYGRNFIINIELFPLSIRRKNGIKSFLAVKKNKGG
jgi:hypothetical protein